MRFLVWRGSPPWAGELRHARLVTPQQQEVDQTLTAGVGAHDLECFVRVQAGASGEDAFGLFELDAAGEGGLRLLGEGRPGRSHRG